MSKQEVLRQAHPGPQTKVLQRTEKEILYGGARGGGKTDAGIAWLLRRIENPGLRALVLRTTYEDLKDWLDRATQLYEHFGGRLVGNPAEIKFPSGAIIRAGYIRDNKSVNKYKGHEYQKIIIEEITQRSSEELYEKLLGSLRSTVEGLKPQILCTTNPDGPGRLRVKRRFVDIVTPGERYTDEQGNTKVFISAKVTDNPTLVNTDPGYINYLKGIKDEQLRKAWLEGDWEAYDIKGGIYTAQLKQARDENRFCKVPYDKALDVHTAWDLGVSDYTTIIFFQKYGKEIRIIDSYHNEGEGLGFYSQVLRDRGYRYGTHYAPHDINVRELITGKSRLDQAREYGLNFDVVPMVSIWDGINKARQVFAQCWFDTEKCKTLLEHLEIYRKEFDEKHQVFKHKPYHGAESHFADSFRYLCSSIEEESHQPTMVYTDMSDEL